jgi:hypothetical protein
MAPKTVTTLLRALPPDELSAMRDGIASEIGKLEAEVARLQTELALVDEAASKSPRRRPRKPQTAGRGRNARTQQRDRDGGFQGLPRSDLLRLIEEYGQPAHPARLREFLSTKGIEMDPKALHTSMARLERKDHKLVRVAPSTWATPEMLSRNGSRSNEADSPLSRENQLQSHD